MCVDDIGECNLKQLPGSRYSFHGISLTVQCILAARQYSCLGNFHIYSILINQQTDLVTFFFFFSVEVPLLSENQWFLCMQCLSTSAWPNLSSEASVGVRGLIKPLRGMERGNNHPVISSRLTLLLFVFLSLRSASFPTKPGRKASLADCCIIDRLYRYQMLC